MGGGSALSGASVPQPAAFGELFRTGRARLLQLHKPPPPSSALFFELTQQVAAANGGSGSDGDGYDSVVSQLVILDVEVGMHGDPLWNAMRQTLSSASQQQPLGGASGAVVEEGRLVEIGRPSLWAMRWEMDGMAAPSFLLAC